MGTGQRGFTLVEMLMAVAIVGMIVPLLISGIFQVTRGTVRVNTDLGVMQDIDGASTWINRDLSQAQETNLNEGETLPTMRVDWVDQTGWAVEGAESHFAEYTLVGTNLVREYDGENQIVARRIASIQFSRSGKFVTVTITSTFRDRTETLSYFVTPRTDGALP